ncbi:CAAX prenyl protease [Globisporangium polare]
MRFSVTPSSAVAACFCMAAAYVGVLYTLPRTIRRLPRDHPTHILARFLLICIFCALCPFLLAVFYEHDDRSISFAAWLGIRHDGLAQAILVPLFITALLFTGSLLANAIRLLNVSKQFHSNGVWFAVKNSALYYSVTHDRLPSLRNYVLGPLTEEFVFRSCMIPLLVCANFTVKQIILGSPLTFGVAHLHHFVDHVRNGRSAKDAALIAGFQLLYTSIFGAYASFLYLRTGHFASIFIVHVFCNVIGFPDLSFFNPENSLHPFRIVILGAYFVGIYSFTRTLVPWTEPSIYSSDLWNITTSIRANDVVGF